MRILKFLHTDFLKVRHSIWALALALISAILLIRNPEYPALFAVAYGVFVSMVFASFPYNAEQEAERGFLQMLPAKPGEQIWGHYLFGLLTVVSGLLLGLFSVLIARAVVPAVSWLTREELLGFCPILLGLSLLMVGLEDLLLTVFRFDNLRVTQLFRIVPAFIFFFFASSITDSLPDAADGSFLLNLGNQGLCILALCALLFWLTGYISARISAARGQS